MKLMARRQIQPRVKRSLTLAEFEQARGHLCAEMAAKAKLWSSHGWAAVGPTSALRIEIAVARKLVRPAHAIGPLRLPRRMRGLIKPCVRASLHALSLPLPSVSPRTARSGSSAASTITVPLAPGTRIFVNSSQVQRAGIACFVNADDELYLVTCGHVFEPGATDTGVFAHGTRIARLTRNFLDDAQQLDAAFCRVLPAGKTMLAASADAPTWYADVLSPADGQNEDAIFWPTNEDADGAIATRIDSFSACDSTIHNDFWTSLSLCNMVRTEQITIAGDSGSLLSVDDKYYALCTGAPNWSFYTPLFDVIDRMREEFTKVELWHPN